MTVVLLHSYLAPPSRGRKEIHFFFLPPLAPLPPALAASAFLFPCTVIPRLEHGDVHHPAKGDLPGGGGRRGLLSERGESHEGDRHRRVHRGHLCAGESSRR